MSLRLPPLVVLLVLSLTTITRAFDGRESVNTRAELDSLLSEHDSAESSLDPVARKSLRSRIDSAAHQKDAVYSRLFWHTDLDTAMGEARQSGKPVLSLRLLGTLDSDLSCANSRFFRTVLYANASTSRFLRDNYVLHWQSVRPVPVITIDMGDGRVIKRTITGNSIHYILAPDGTVVDALPGLYAPATFLGALTAARDVCHQLRDASPGARARSLRLWQSRRSAELSNTLVPVVAVAAPVDAGPPDARQAAERAPSKLAVERRPLRAQAPPNAANELTAHAGVSTNPSGWERFLPAAKLDESSRALIREKSREPSIESLVTTLQENIAKDTAINDCSLRPRILNWLAQGQAHDLNALNERVYAELFLTPSTDPWLGLAPVGVYSALDDDGLVDCPK